MTVWEDLLVKNAMDVEDARRGIIPPEKIRQTTVHFKVDTGAHWNCVNQDVCNALGLHVKGYRDCKTAGGGEKTFGVAGQMEIHWNDREVVMETLVSPQPGNNLLACTALELLALKVDPVNVCLEPAFPNGIMGEIE